MFHNSTKCEMCGILKTTLNTFSSSFTHQNSWTWGFSVEWWAQSLLFWEQIAKNFHQYSTIKIITDTGRCEQIYLIYTFKIHHTLVQCTHYKLVRGSLVIIYIKWYTAWLPNKCSLQAHTLVRPDPQYVYLEKQAHWSLGMKVKGGGGRKVSCIPRMFLMIKML